MVTTNSKAMFTARPLTRAIYREAEAKGLDPTILAAMVWEESWYQLGVKGSSYESGLWQVWPWASALTVAWEELRKAKRIGDFPDVDWKKIPLRTRWKITSDIEIGTYLATNLIKIFRDYCLKKKHDHRRPTDPYAHYNTGYTHPRSGYMLNLWKRTRLIRVRIGRPEFTESDYKFYNRMVPSSVK